MKIIYSDMDLPTGTDDMVIFLAGPTPRDPKVKSWRPGFIEQLEKSGYQGIVLVPERSTGTDYDYLPQVKWEETGLEITDLIIFWVPRDLDTMPGFTTNIEFGEWMSSGKCILGFPKDAPNTRYMEYKAGVYDIPLFYNIPDICEHLRSVITTGRMKGVVSHAKMEAIRGLDYEKASRLRDLEKTKNLTWVMLVEKFTELGIKVPENHVK